MLNPFSGNDMFKAISDYEYLPLGEEVKFSYYIEDKQFEEIYTNYFGLSEYL